MKKKQCKERRVVSPIIRHYIIQNQSEKQKDNAEKRKKQSARQNLHSRQAIDVFVLVENIIEKRPDDGYQQNAVIELGVIKDGLYGMPFHVFAVSKE